MLVPPREVARHIRASLMDPHRATNGAQSRGPIALDPVHISKIKPSSHIFREKQSTQLTRTSQGSCSLESFTFNSWTCISSKMSTSMSPTKRVHAMPLLILINPQEYLKSHQVTFLKSKALPKINGQR
jgi:hypothetical protein